MNDLNIAIGALDAERRVVPVTFTRGELVHKRDVNACYDADGDYDAAATAERVDQVALGVAVKMDVGAITNPPADPIAPEAPAE